MKKAFTLVEILIVVVLIGILAALVTSVGTNYLKSARDAQRKSDLKTIRDALISAGNDCKGKAYVPWAYDNDVIELSKGFSHYASVNIYLHRTGHLKKQLWDPLEPQDTVILGGDPYNSNSISYTTTDVHQRYKFYDGHLPGGGDVAESNVCPSINNSNFSYGGNFKGYSLFRVQLEKGNSDKDASASYNRCIFAITNNVIDDLPSPAPNDGHYYTCD